MPLSKEEKVKFLKGVNFFEGLCGMDLEKIADVVEEKYYRKNEPIVREGEEGDAMFIIVSGIVKITRMEGDRESMIAVMKKGEIIGEVALFDAQPRSATVTAMEDEVVVLSLSRSQFVTLIGQIPEIALSMLRLMARRIRVTTQAYTMLQ